MKKYKFIVGFTGIGKSYFHKDQNYNTVEIDDVSKFDLNELKNDKSIDYVLIDSLESNITQLKELDLKFLLIYPHISIKDYYLKNYDQNAELYNRIQSEWNSTISIFNEMYVPKLVLGPNEYLSSIIPHIDNL